MYPTKRVYLLELLNQKEHMDRCKRRGKWGLEGVRTEDNALDLGVEPC